jgi:hypothetical protein
MKAFLQHDDSGLFYDVTGGWVPEPQRALAFTNTEDAERFRNSERIPSVHAVLRIDPQLLERMSSHPPGVYQMGE